jgi:hypothetical protein
MPPALPRLLLLAALAAGCSSFPALDARTSRAAAQAPYPSLLPLDRLLAAAAPRAGAADPAIDPAAGVAARAAGLRARAAALRARPVIEPAARARLVAALAARTG